MFLQPFEISQKSTVAEIVAQDYRTADVFRRHGIGYCCGGKWPLEMVCNANNIDIKVLTKELENATRTVQLPNSLPFNEWDIDFLADYILHVHHQYLKNQLPEIKSLLLKFAVEHRKKYLYIADLEKTFLRLYNEMLPHLQQEEEIIFPYIRQITHAFDSREPYASLLVRTLRKPIEVAMNHEHTSVIGALQRMRELTHDYTAPVQACVSHKVVFLKLKELDNDLMQHMHLENNFLFPRVIEMEKEVLKKYPG